MLIQLFLEMYYVHSRMCLEIKSHVMFDINDNIILQYSTTVRFQVMLFFTCHIRQRDPPCVGLNYCKEGFFLNNVE